MGKPLYIPQRMRGFRLEFSPPFEAAVQGSQSRAQFSNWLCYELTPSCKKKPPPLPKDRLFSFLLEDPVSGLCAVQGSSA